MLLIPQKVLNEMERSLRTFFWSGPDLKTTGAKVNWDSVCLPEECGLGFRKLKDWNRASMTRHLWAEYTMGEMGPHLYQYKPMHLEFKSSKLRNLDSEENSEPKALRYIPLGG